MNIRCDGAETEPAFSRSTKEENKMYVTHLANIFKVIDQNTDTVFEL